ncbi:MAG: NAD(P)H-hydrate epimerase [Erysipelotrichaceae bacterium]|nr:NAD(P)H-hydrate epimerase [Erysipelotrichaceae bacterium]
MIEYLTASQSKKADIIAIEERGIDSLWLMENASRAVAEYISEHYEGKVLVISSVGNNGADGLCVARLLINKGYEVETLVIGNIEKATWEFKHQLSALNELNGVVHFNETEIPEHDICVDGLFGIGLRRNIEGSYAEVIEKLNKYPSKKVAIDVPSGLNGDNGQIMGIGLKTDVTVTFGKIKTGMVNGQGPEYCGKIIVCDIGIPEDVYSEACL